MEECLKRECLLVWSGKLCAENVHVLESFFIETKSFSAGLQKVLNDIWGCSCSKMMTKNETSGSGNRRCENVLLGSKTEKNVNMRQQAGDSLRCICSDCILGCFMSKDEDEGLLHLCCENL